ncbi:hypothetical protein ACP8HI_18850 [Paenibacillus sp. FA6]|uniref:hypothetical protein n=1 Tax=Paenibacillus sp. FA6 TaxID=3413029 RepID=UPI003F66014C
MDYFVLRQDERYTQIPMIEQLRTQINTRHIHLTDAHHIPDTSIFYVKADQETTYLDFLDRQLVLMSNNMKQLIDLYQPDYITKLVVLIDRTMQKQSEYYLPIFKEISCLSPNTEFHHDHTTIKRLVLQESQIQNHQIFQIKESEKPLIVIRLDVAESIFRRGFTGICLDRISVE